MSIDIEVHGDSSSVTTAATNLSDIATTLSTVASDLTTIRSDADSAWDGYRSTVFLGDVDTAKGEIETFSEKVSTFATAVENFASTMSTVEDDMAQIRSDAYMAGLTVGANSIEYPESLGYDASPEQEQERTDRLEAWRSLEERSVTVRSTETTAHDELGSAITAFLSNGVVLDLLERAGFVPGGSGAHDISTWAFGLATSAFGWTADWWTRIKVGRYAPRGPGGRFRAVTQPWYREAWSARQSNNWVARPGQAATRNNWMTAGKWVGRAGTVVSFGTAAWGQWQEDADDPSINTSEQVGRAATVGATTAAGGWAGAAAGAKVGAVLGTAIGGPVGTVIGGAVGGLVGGMIGAGVGEAIGDALKEPAGKFIDAITFWD